jgi:mono/diheme cytochrome c family protein
MAIDMPAGHSEQRIALPEVALPSVADASGAPLAPGKAPYEQFCAGCHGTTAEGGGNGPSLTVPAARHDLAAIVAFVKNPNPPMPKLHPSPLNDEHVTAVAEYVRTLQQRSAQR